MGLALKTTASSLSGALLGLYLSVAGPLAVAVVKNQNPVHRGWYFEAIQAQLFVLPPALAICLGWLTWRQRLSSALCLILWCLGAGLFLLTVLWAGLIVRAR